MFYQAKLTAAMGIFIRQLPKMIYLKSETDSHVNLNREEIQTLSTLNLAHNFNDTHAYPGP